MRYSVEITQEVRLTFRVEVDGTPNARRMAENAALTIVREGAADPVARSIVHTYAVSATPLD